MIVAPGACDGISALAIEQAGYRAAYMTGSGTAAALGLDEAIVCANEALAAGADLAFVEAAQTLDELASIPRRVNGPCLLNRVVGGKTPPIGLDDAQAMG